MPRPPKVLNPAFSAVQGPPSRSALLLVVGGPNAGCQFLLDQPVTSAGRHLDSDIFLDDVTVSGYHVEFRALRTTNYGKDKLSRARESAGRS